MSRESTRLHRILRALVAAYPAALAGARPAGLPFTPDELRIRERYLALLSELRQGKRRTAYPEGFAKSESLPSDTPRSCPKI